MTGGADKVGLVVGASGIIGRAVSKELITRGWSVIGLGRRPIGGMPSISVDLTDSAATQAALGAASGVTHVFYAALSPDPDLGVEAGRNAAMLAAVLDGLEAIGSPLRRVVVYQGFKIYGVHLGARVRTPARESDPSHMPPNLYLAQEAQLKERAKGSAWDYVALRPDVVVGDTYGNPMNIATTIGVYAEISRALGVPLRFPGLNSAYDKLAQFTDAGLLARASLWAAETPSAGGEAFNVTNGDVFRWERMWEDVAHYFQLDVAPPVPLVLSKHMMDKGPLWRQIASRYRLVENDLSRLVSWSFGDFIFRIDSDVICDVNKIHDWGFGERMNSRASLIGVLESLRRQKILP
jgi:nucleoside-diphosphate-sugar epimerase